MKIGQEASRYIGLASERNRISYRQLSEPAPGPGRAVRWFRMGRIQGRTQEFFPGGGGKIIYIRWEKQARARSARAGGGCGRGVFLHF